MILDQYPKLPHLVTVTRLDKPIGIYLLLWPTLWALWIAADGFPGWHLLVVFVLGTLLMRSAGCVINDIADRDFDTKVKRTVDRPLATGDLELKDAIILLGALVLAAFLLVLTTNLLTILLAFCAALVAGLYPFMKRYTYLPQVVLGVAFSFGIPMAFAAQSEEVPLIAWLMVIANVLWTVGYDTAYAMVDRDDDLKIGIKSTAILFGDMDKLMIGALQASFLMIMLLLHRHMELGWYYNAALFAAMALFVYQQYLIKDRNRENCFSAFLNNHWVGLAIFLGLLAEIGF